MATHVGILPKDVLDSLLLRLDAGDGQRGLRFLRLPHPRTGVSSLFLPYESSATKQTSILEVQVVAPPNERSWFLSEGQVIGNGNLLVITPVDPVFLLISILQHTIAADGSPGAFRPADDLYELAIEKLTSSPVSAADPKDPSTQLCREDITSFMSLPCAQRSMGRVCEVKDVTPDITVYRFSIERVIACLQTKVTRLNNPGLLESSRAMIRALASDGLMDDGKEHLLEAGRLRAACDFVAQYTPQNIRDALFASYDFADLNVYLKSLEADVASIAAAEMDKAEARESRRSAAAKSASATDKKRKGPAKTSTGVEKLKRANTAGMAKLSSFFQPKTR